MTRVHNPYQAVDVDVCKPPVVSKSAVVTSATDKTIAERFRTKMCRNFVTNHTCPYDTRCMFAHGDNQLRTKEDNLRDGLTSEEAIKIFKREELMAADLAAQRSGQRQPMPFAAPANRGFNSYSSYMPPCGYECASGMMSHRAAFLPPPPSPSYMDSAYMNSGYAWPQAIYYDADDDEIASEPSTEANSIEACHEEIRSVSTPSKLMDLF